MRRIIKIASLSLTLLMVLSLTACGKKKGADTQLIFGKTDLSEYVNLPDYKNLSVDTSSEEYVSAYETELKSDVERNDLYTKKYEGKVANGDIANIDYVGKKDGVAFEGGTAEEYDLTIGSHSFIDGFEDGLIGVNIGDTVDLNLTFPEGYQSAELAGKAVVFTVKVNYVKTTDSPEIEKIYDKLGFKSAKDYEADLEKRATKSVLFDSVLNDSEVKGYPESDKKTFVDAVYELYSNYYKNYNMNFEDVLQSNNMTVEDYKNQVAQSADSQLKGTIISYAILQKEGLKAQYDLSDDKKTGVDVLDEMTQAEYAVKDFLYDNRK